MSSSSSNDADIEVPSVSSQLLVYLAMGVFGYVLTNWLVPSIKVRIYIITIIICTRWFILTGRRFHKRSTTRILSKALGLEKDHSIRNRAWNIPLVGSAALRFAMIDWSVAQSKISISDIIIISIAPKLHWTYPTNTQEASTTNNLYNWVKCFFTALKRCILIKVSLRGLCSSRFRLGHRCFLTLERTLGSRLSSDFQWHLLVSTQKSARAVSWMDRKTSATEIPSPLNFTPCLYLHKLDPIVGWGVSSCDNKTKIEPWLKGMSLSYVESGTHLSPETSFVWRTKVNCLVFSIVRVAVGWPPTEVSVEDCKPLSW